VLIKLSNYMISHCNIVTVMKIMFHAIPHHFTTVIVRTNRVSMIIISKISNIVTDTEIHCLLYYMQCTVFFKY